MILYNVTLNMEPIIEGEAIIWMEEVFIPLVMKSGSFHEFQVCKLKFADQENPAYAVQFYCNNEINKEDLLHDGQLKYLDKVFETWGLQVMPFATVMDIIKPAYLSFIHQN